MSYRIRVSPSAQKEIRTLPGHVRRLAIQLIDALAEKPRPARAKELRGKPNIYRIWLAKNWRIVYQIDDDSKMLLIMRVHRKEQIDYENL